MVSANLTPLVGTPAPNENERAHADDLAAALRESEEKCRFLADAITDVISIHDWDGRFLYVSPSLFKMTGYLPEETIGQALSSAVHPDDQERLFREASPVFEGVSVTIKWRRLCKNGTYRWVETIAHSIYDEAGRLHRFGAVTRDVSAKKQAQERLRRGEQIENQAQALAQLGVWEWDLATNTVTWSNQYVRFIRRGPGPVFRLRRLRDRPEPHPSRRPPAARKCRRRLAARPAAARLYLPHRVARRQRAHRSRAGRRSPGRAGRPSVPAFRGGPGRDRA